MSTKLGTIIADFRTSLSAKMSISDTTGTLQSAVDDDGVALPAGIYFFTLDSENSSKEHIVCTLAGTALTGISSVSRQGVQTSGLVREHRVGASVVGTDFAHIKYINDILDATTDLDATTPLQYDGTASILNDESLATKKYVDDTAIAGGALASSTVTGISKLSINPASPTDPIAVGDNDTRVPIQGENDALVGTSGTPSTSNKYVTDDDTAASGAASTSKVIRWNASAKLETADISGNLTDATNADSLHIHTTGKQLVTTTQITIVSSTTETSLGSFTLAAALLSTNNAIKIEIPVGTIEKDSGTITLRLKYGSTTVATGVVSDNLDPQSGVIHAYLMGNGTTSAQVGILNGVFADTNSVGTVALNISNRGTSAEDSTGALTVDVTAQFSVSAAGNQIITDGIIATLIR